MAEKQSQLDVESYSAPQAGSPLRAKQSQI